MSRVKKAPVKAKAKPASSKKTKPKQEDTALHQEFVNSLINLQSYWKKKEAALKNQVAIIKGKLEKATLKQKAAKARKATKSSLEKISQQVNVIQEELAKARQIMSQAKLAVNKFAALGKMIEQFERDWLKNLATKESNKTEKIKAETKPKTSSKKKTKPDSNDIPKTLVSPQKTPFSLGDLFDDASLDEAHEDAFDEVDIFAPIDEFSDFETVEGPMTDYSDEDPLYEE